MTVNGFKNTVRCDEEVFRWATALLEAECVRKTLPLNKIQVLKSLHFFIMAANLAVAWFIFVTITFSFGLLSFFLILASILGIYLIEIPYKNLTASLAGDFISAQFPIHELEKQTLLQLSVRLEKKYGVYPLVDMLSGWTKLFRITFVIAYITVTWILFFNFSTRVGLLLCGAWLLRAVSRSTLFRSCLRISCRKETN